MGRQASPNGKSLVPPPHPTHIHSHTLQRHPTFPQPQNSDYTLSSCPQICAHMPAPTEPRIPLQSEPLQAPRHSPSSHRVTVQHTSWAPAVLWRPSLPDKQIPSAGRPSPPASSTAGRHNRRARRKQTSRANEGAAAAPWHVARQRKVRLPGWAPGKTGWAKPARLTGCQEA